MRENRHCVEWGVWGPDRTMVKGYILALTLGAWVYFRELVGRATSHLERDLQLSQRERG